MYQNTKFKLHTKKEPKVENVIRFKANFQLRGKIPTSDGNLKC